MMEISLTLNNELVFNKEFTKKDYIKAGIKITGIALLVTTAILFVSNTTVLAATLEKPISSYVCEELNRIFLSTNDMSYIDKAIKHYTPLDFEAIKYITKITGECVKNAFIKDIHGGAVPIVKLLKGGLLATPGVRNAIRIRYFIDSFNYFRL